MRYENSIRRRAECFVIRNSDQRFEQSNGHETGISQLLLTEPVSFYCFVKAVLKVSVSQEPEKPGRNSKWEDKMKQLTLGSVLALGVGVVAGAALAEYPERPINMVIPYGAGGATDISARTIAEPLGEAVGSALVMANITGAGGATGSVAVQNANADGYTMLFARVG